MNRKKKKITQKDSYYCLTKSEKNRIRKFLYEREGKFLKSSLKKFYFEHEVQNGKI